MTEWYTIIVPKWYEQKTKRLKADNIMFRVINKFNGKQYGVDCMSMEEAECLQFEHEHAIIVNLDISKETRKETVKHWWEIMVQTQEDRKNGLITREEEDMIREIWVRLDMEYTAMYDEEY